MKPPTIKAIAKILNVSVSTVSRALNDHPRIGPVTKMKVKKLADELNYLPNQAAIFLQKGKSRTIGLILPEISEAFFSAAINGIEEIADERNYALLIAQSHDCEAAEQELILKMRNQRIDGVLISIAKNTSNYDHFELLRKANIPVVFFDRVPFISNIHSVACNIGTGTFEAIKFLLKQGHRVIGMINGPATLYASKERKDGYIYALFKNRLKYDPSLVVNSDLTEHGTVDAIKRLLNNKRRPTAIVAFNDYVALFAIRYARSQQIKINEELTFVSYANLPLINYVGHIPVASVEQFPYLQGRRATDILIDLINEKHALGEKRQAYYHIIVESQLVVNNKAMG